MNPSLNLSLSLSPPPDQCRNNIDENSEKSNSEKPKGYQSSPDLKEEANCVDSLEFSLNHNDNVESVYRELFEVSKPLTTPSLFDSTSSLLDDFDMDCSDDHNGSDNSGNSANVNPKKCLFLELLDQAHARQKVFENMEASLSRNPSPSRNPSLS